MGYELLNAGSTTSLPGALVGASVGDGGGVGDHVKRPAIVGGGAGVGGGACVGPGVTG